MLIVGSLVAPAAAETSGGNGPVTVKARVNLLGQLTLSATTVNFGSVNPGTTTAANAISNAETATVKTNSSSWNLTQQITSDFTGTAPNKIELDWEHNGVGPYAAMGVSAADTVASGGITDGSTTSYGLDYGLNVPWTIAPATNSASVTYTLSY